MNNFSKYLCIGALGLGLWSCSSDEPESSGNLTFTGEQALMTVNLYSPESMTRAGDVNEGDGQYDNGTADENAITKVDFYFYDKAGDYVTDYKGAVFDYTTDNTDPLVSKIGSSKIVLTNLPGKNYPAYMIAIANAPSTLDLSDISLIGATATANSVANKNVEKPWAVGTNGKAQSFIMTSATHDRNAADFYYFATPLSPENFAEIKDDANSGQGDPWLDNQGRPISTTPVDLYIERLAAKVELTFNSQKFTLTDNGYYEMSMDPYEITTGYNDEGIAQTVTRNYKIRLYGWGVNGEAKNMRYFKRVNSVTSVNGPFKTSDGWDFNGTNRCYWARTPGYGQNSYPSSFEDVTTKTGGTEGPNDIYANSETLKYISWNDVSANSFADGNTTAYIRPHTEIGEQLNLSGNQLRHSAVTEVLISGQLVDETGAGVDLFQIGETYYTADGIINYVLHSAGKHIWKKTGENTSSSITSEDVQVRYDYDGVFKFELTNKNNTVWYSDKECTTAWNNSSDIYTNHSGVEKELNSYLPEKQTYGYKDGLMYYNIPIRHLRPYNSSSNEEIKTGMFGVVRNHWYKITVTNLTKLGHSVYRPEEHIIPPSDDTQFMIGSSIKIVSWRMVPQSAEL